MTDKKDDWDDALGESKQNGISPDMARALLTLNPKLRDEGKNTAWVLASGRRTNTPPPTAAQSAEGDACSELERRRQKLENDDKIAEAQIAELRAVRLRARADTLDSVCRYFIANDPKLLSPLTHQALAEQKTFLDKIGFSTKGFVELKRKLGMK